MTAGRDDATTSTGPGDARSAALAEYLRTTAAAFSLSGDITEMPTTAEAGMALLDAAAIAESMQTDDPAIRVLSEAGLFETMPLGKAVFLEIPEIRAAIQRTLLDAESGADIISRLVATAAARDEPPHQNS